MEIATDSLLRSGHETTETSTRSLEEEEDPSTYANSTSRYTSSASILSMSLLETKSLNLARTDFLDET